MNKFNAISLPSFATPHTLPVYTSVVAFEDRDCDIIDIGEGRAVVSRDLTYCKVFRDLDAWDIKSYVEANGGRVLSVMFDQDPNIKLENEWNPSIKRQEGGMDIDDLVPKSVRNWGRWVLIAVVAVGAVLGGLMKGYSELSFRDECAEVHQKWDTGGITSEAWMEGTARIWAKYGK